jgi:hypothetical protein
MEQARMLQVVTIKGYDLFHALKTFNDKGIWGGGTAFWSPKVASQK